MRVYCNASLNRMQKELEVTGDVVIVTSKVFLRYTNVSMNYKTLSTLILKSVPSSRGHVSLKTCHPPIGCVPLKYHVK